MNAPRAIIPGGSGGITFDTSDRSGFIIQTCAAMAALSTTSILLRFLSRKITKMPLLSDDWLILLALPFALATAFLPISGAKTDNFGRHAFPFSTLDSLHRFLSKLYALEITYTLAVSLPKFSMIALYWRVFPSRVSIRGFNVALKATTMVTAMWLIAMTITAVFSCTPVEGFWLFENKAHCIDSFTFFTASASLNIAIDVALLALPAVMVSSLQLTTWQKVAVSCTFLVGIFVTICSCIRLSELISASKNGLHTDPVWVLVDSAIWSVVEVNLSIVCACLPSIRPLLRLVRGRIRAYASQPSSRNYRISKNSSASGGGGGGRGDRQSRLSFRCPQVYWPGTSVPISDHNISTRIASGEGPRTDRKGGGRYGRCLAVEDLDDPGGPGRVWVRSEVRVERSREDAPSIELEDWPGRDRSRDDNRVSLTHGVDMAPILAPRQSSGHLGGETSEPVRTARRPQCKQMLPVVDATPTQMLSQAEPLRQVKIQDDERVLEDEETDIERLASARPAP